LCDFYHGNRHRCRDILGPESFPTGYKGQVLWLLAVVELITGLYEMAANEGG
jgi:hypothetical protein